MGGLSKKCMHGIARRCLSCLQAADGDSLPDYPDDADIPAGGEGVSYMINAAKKVKAAGNALFKEVLQPCDPALVKCGA